MSETDASRQIGGVMFHLSQLFARTTVNTTSGSDYEALARNEEQECSTETDDTAQSVPHSDVQGFQEWQILSIVERTAVQCAFGILGAAVLLPFNATITPSEFYRTLLSNTPYEASFMSWIVVVYNVASIVLGAHATATMSRSSAVRRVTMSTLVIISTLFIVTLLAFCVKHFGLKHLPSAFPVILLLTLLLAGTTSYLQVAVVTLSNAFGPTCLGTMLAGQGMVGVVVSVIQLTSAYASAAQNESEFLIAKDGQEEASAAAASFFAVNTAFMVGALMCFWRLRRSSLFNAIHERMEIEKQSEIEQSQGDERHDRPDTTLSSHANVRHIRGVRRYMSKRIQATFDRIMDVQGKAFVACMSIAFVFVITLSVFPALTSRVRPQKKQENDKAHQHGAVLVFVAWHFVAFNASDLLGRSLPTAFPRLFCVERLGILVLGCLARTAFLPLLAACNISAIPPQSPLVGRSIQEAIKSSTPSSSFSTPIFFLLITLLGLSNGLLATNIFIIGPRQSSLANDAERSLSVALLTWWLTVGLAIGSLVSFFV